MSTTNGDEYELIEVPVSRKIEVNMTLDDLLNALTQQANALTSGAQQAPSQVLDRLKQLGQLAHEIRGEVGQLRQPDPTRRRRLMLASKERKPKSDWFGSLVGMVVTSLSAADLVRKVVKPPTARYDYRPTFAAEILREYLRLDRPTHRLGQTAAVRRPGRPARRTGQTAPEEPARHVAVPDAAAARAPVARHDVSPPADARRHLQRSARPRHGCGQHAVRAQRPQRIHLARSGTAIMHPNPRVVSRELLTRDTFAPATSLNTLAAAWIQFMTRDWFSHGAATSTIPGRSRCRPVTTSRRIRCSSRAPSAIRPGRRMTRPRRQPTSTWKRRGGTPRRSIRPIRSCSPACAPGRRQTAPGAEGGRPSCRRRCWRSWRRARAGGWPRHAANVFAREHNAICDRLAREYPDWSDEQLFQKARLINAALLAKIHTVEWSPRSSPIRPRRWRSAATGGASAARNSIPCSGASVTAICFAAFPGPRTTITVRPTR